MSYRYIVPKRYGAGDAVTRPEHLVIAARESRGVPGALRGPVNAGAEALATWLLAYPHVAEQIGCSGLEPFASSERVERMLAGAWVPGNDLVEQIGKLTGGAVTAALFEQPGSFFHSEAVPRNTAASDCGDGAPPRPVAAPPSQIAPMRGAMNAGAAPGRSAPAFEVHPLGTVPPGPLFQAVRHGNENIWSIAGLGLTLTVDLAGLCGLNDVTGQMLIEAVGREMHAVAAE